MNHENQNEATLTNYNLSNIESLKSFSTNATQNSKLSLFGHQDRIQKLSFRQAFKNFALIFKRTGIKSKRLRM